MTTRTNSCCFPKGHMTLFIALAWSNKRWGLFIGFSADSFWNDTTLFVDTFLKNGLEQGFQFVPICTFQYQVGSAIRS
jgi:hypothetical protein